MASRAAAEAVRRRRSNHDTARSRRDRGAGRGPRHRRDQSEQQKAEAWTEAAAAHGQAVRHQLMISGHVVWCNVCGAFGSQRGRGLAHSCPGPVQVGGTGGRSQQLRRLRAGFHPKDRVSLPAAIPRAEWADDELSRAQRALAAALWHLEPQKMEGEADADDDAQHGPRHHEGPHDDEAKGDDPVAEVLMHTEYGRMCVRNRCQKRPAMQPAISEAQIRLRGIRARVREREHSGHGTDQIDLTQELADIMATTLMGDDSDSAGAATFVGDDSAVRSAPERQYADGVHHPASQAHVASEKMEKFNAVELDKQVEGDVGMPIRPGGATTAERTELRDLRHRQAQSGGHPIGESDEEPLLPDDDEDQLADYHRWVSNGRPMVVIRGRPGPGVWDHPWVVYRTDAELEPATKRARGGDSDGPVIPPLPTIGEETLRRLNTTLPPPAMDDAHDPDHARPLTARTTGVYQDAQLGTVTVDGDSDALSDGDGRGTGAQPVNAQQDHASFTCSLRSSHASHVVTGTAEVAGRCIPPRPVLTAAVLSQLDTVLPPPDEGLCSKRALLADEALGPRLKRGHHDATVDANDGCDDDAQMACPYAAMRPSGGIKRQSTAMQEGVGDGRPASPKRARLNEGGIQILAHDSGTFALTGASGETSQRTGRLDLTTTTTTGADRAAPTATPGSAT